MEKQIWVKSYTRKDGSKVEGHYRNVKSRVPSETVKSSRDSISESDLATIKRFQTEMSGKEPMRKKIQDREKYPKRYLYQLLQDANTLDEELKQYSFMKNFREKLGEVREIITSEISYRERVLGE